MEAWNLTFDEYVARRIGDSGVDESTFREAYPESRLRCSYINAIQDPPREADLDLRVYDALPEGLQGRWRKFSFTLDAKLAARDEVKREAEQAPFTVAEKYLRSKIEALETLNRQQGRFSSATMGYTDGLLAKESRELELLRSLQHRLNAPFAERDEKLRVVSQLRRRKDFPK